MAAARGHVEVVALLLRSGASVEVENRLGRCPRGVAAMGTVSGRRADDKLPFSCQVILRKQNEGRLVQVDPFPVSA